MATKRVTKKRAPKMTMSARAVANVLASQAPAGWTASVGDGYHSGDEAWPLRDGETVTAYVVFEATVDTLRVKLALNVLDAGAYDTPFMGGHVVEGHTTYNSRSFTRRGIDCESCGLTKVKPAERAEHQYGDVASLVGGEAARCLADAARSKTLQPVPGTPFSRQPEWFTQAGIDLTNCHVVFLTPHGFGTGIALRRGTPRGHERRASAALEAALGVSPIALSDFDHD
jgi:hypothetical protein